MQEILQQENAVLASEGSETTLRLATGFFRSGI